MGICWPFLAAGEDHFTSNKCVLDTLPSQIAATSIPSRTAILYASSSWSRIWDVFSRKPIEPSCISFQQPYPNDAVPVVEASVRVPPSTFTAQDLSLPVSALQPGNYTVNVTSVTAAGPSGSALWTFPVEVRFYTPLVLSEKIQADVMIWNFDWVHKRLCCTNVLQLVLPGVIEM